MTDVLPFPAPASDTLTLNRFTPRPAPQLPFGKGLVGVVLDVETTGLDTERDKVIELSLVPFVFHPESGDVIEYAHALTWLNDPGVALPAEITRITGITSEAVLGKSIDTVTVDAVVSQAELVISHNAKFDRPFAERISPMFSELRWACSYEDVRWREHYASSNLEFLAFKHLDAFFDAHRADVDSYAVVELLGEPFGDGRLPMLDLLDRIRGRWWRVYSNGERHLNYKVKARGYRWSGGDDGRPQGWWIDVRDGDEVDAETAWLGREVRDRSPMLRAINARNRFTSRL